LDDSLKPCNPCSGVLSVIKSSFLQEFPPWLSTSFSPRRATFTDCGVFGKYASNLSYSAFVAAAGSSPHAFVPVGIAALLFVIRLETLIREGRREIIIGDSFHFEARMAE
jgi:hypothetical protein